MATQDNEVDNPVDEEIYSGLQLVSPKSFFLFAGAGSGKTSSLVKALQRIRAEQGYILRINRKNVAVITYTNAACNEILHRLSNDKLFAVSTIHSFIWELIKHYPSDIREWLRVKLAADIIELNDLQSRARGVNKSYKDRARKIDSKSKRIERLDEIKRFTYNPNGDNTEKDSLNHSEVIGIGASFLQEKILMQQILVMKFPILLIDESQDTNKDLITSFFLVQNLFPKQFSLGLFGDTMQRIYFDGKEDLGMGLPADWIQPAKKMNHRSAKRIITLINKIREGVDGREQLPRTDKPEGFVRFFIASAGQDKSEIEKIVGIKMAELTGDSLWKDPDQDIKALILEHHMAANRLGFLELYGSLNSVERFKTGLLDGTLSGLRLFTETILPLVEAKRKNDEFSVAKIVREKSELLEYKVLKAQKDQLAQIDTVNKYVNELIALWKDEKGPQLVEILRFVAATKLFPVPNSLQTIADRSAEEHLAAQEEIAKMENEEVEDSEENEGINAWDLALSQPFEQVEKYYKYISGATKFDTHQGVKGREFPRVMMIIDDSEAKGFQFSYDKLFGAKELTATDQKNAREGKDTASDRTRRLFYVGCSRAQDSLAIVAYSENPTAIKKTLLENEWFSDKEIEVI